MAKFKIIFKLEVKWFKYYIAHLRFLFCSCLFCTVRRRQLAFL